MTTPENDLAANRAPGGPSSPAVRPSIITDPLVTPVVDNHSQFLQVLELAGFDKEGISLIDAAYDIAKRAHVEASRDGGGRYFNHCRSVALILVQEAGVRDPNVVAAALLHDSVEDTSTFGSYNIYGVIGLREVAHQRISRFFNQDVADYVLAVTKIHKTGDSAVDRKNRLAYFDGLKIAPAGALLVKMADRLHNLRSLESRPMEKQRAQFRETSKVLLPIFEQACTRFQPEVPGISRLTELVRAENEALGARLAA